MARAFRVLSGIFPRCSKKTYTPGHFVAWLYQCEPVRAYNINGNVMDISNPGSLAKARKVLL